MKHTWLLSFVGILAIFFLLQQSVTVEGFTQPPRTAPLSTFQTMFDNAGCKRELEEGDVWWWRTQPNMNIVQNDMNAYAEYTRTCTSDPWRHEFCNPDACKCGWAR
jgi:hypothetical protein